MLAAAVRARGSFSGPATTSGRPTACCRGQRRERVLALLHGSDEEQVAVAATVPGAERGVDAVRRDGDLLRRDPVQLDRIGLRSLRHREHAVGTACGARNDALEDEAVERPHDAGVALEVQVVQRHDGSGRGSRAEGRVGSGPPAGRNRRSRRGSVQAMRSS